MTVYFTEFLFFWKEKKNPYFYSYLDTGNNCGTLSISYHHGNVSKITTVIQQTEINSGLKNSRDESTSKLPSTVHYSDYLDP